MNLTGKNRDEQKANSPRPGEWVALVDDEIVGTGVTESDARCAAKAKVSEETPLLAYCPVDNNPDLLFPDLVDQVRDTLRDDLCDRAWLVGGAVRDALLRRPVRDLDFAVDGDAVAAGRRVANSLGGAFFVLDKKRGTGRVVLANDSNNAPLFLDFSRIRGESIVDDLLERDFTINAIAVPLTGQQTVLDPSGGRVDMEKRLIRAVSSKSLCNDPVRGVRAIRLAIELGFHIDRDTRAQLKNSKEGLVSVSAERLRDEFMPCLGGRNPVAALRALDVVGLLVEIIPETILVKSVNGKEGKREQGSWDHRMSVLERMDSILSVLRHQHDVERASEFALGMVAARLGRFRVHLSDRLDKELSVGRNVRSLLFLGALLYNTGDHQANGAGKKNDNTIRTNRVAYRRACALRLSGQEAEWVDRFVCPPERALPLSQKKSFTPREIHCFFRDVGDVGVEHSLLQLAHVAAKWGPALPHEVWTDAINRTVEVLEAYYYQYSEVVEPKPLLNGKEIMDALNISPGPQVGLLLRMIVEAQAAGEVVTGEEAVSLASYKIRDAGVIRKLETRST